MSVFFMDFDMAPSVIWARDLYDQMQIRSDFRKWFPRMCQYGFVEGRDYEFVPRVRPQDEGGRTVQRYVKDYRITLEMAKQLYKLHHFHKNDCFRSCEGQHCMGTDHWMQAVIELLHQHKCKSHAPPKRFYESQPPDSLVTTMIAEAEKYLGMPYVWGGSSPSTSFDCSGFVCWVINNCGNGWNVGRTTANGLRGKCSYVSPANAQPGDLIFFEKTYNTVGASHVGIYVGNGMMIHCGDPISYTSINSTYWQNHFLGFGRIK